MPPILTIGPGGPGAPGTCKVSTVSDCQFCYIKQTWDLHSRCHYFCHWSKCLVKVAWRGYENMKAISQILR